MIARRLSHAIAACGSVAVLIVGPRLFAGQGPPPQVGGLTPPPYAKTLPPPGVVPVEVAAPSRVSIASGEFWMGRTRLWLMDEIGWQIRERFDDRPVHRVRLDAFTIDPYEVTNARYAAFLASPAGKGVTPPFHWGGPMPPKGKEELPVYNVTWHDAVRYCTAQGGRLPTEAEWEYAARAGAADLDYPWGNEYLDAPAEPGKPAPKRAHSGSSTGPVKVGSFAPNALGLYDVSGNVWEWTADWYDLLYYSESPVERPTGPPTGLYRVIRGGSWADTETRLGTLYYRNFTAPDTAQPTIGIRCAGPAATTR